jgi:hypothetical protein
MVLKLIKNRDWKLRFSLLKRCCYLSGENLTLKYCYVGRKPIKDIFGNKYLNDDIWISQREYLKMLRNDIL